MLKLQKKTSASLRTPLHLLGPNRHLLSRVQRRMASQHAPRQRPGLHRANFQLKRRATQLPRAFITQKSSVNVNQAPDAHTSCSLLRVLSQSLAEISIQPTSRIPFRVVHLVLAAHASITSNSVPVNRPQLPPGLPLPLPL